VLTISGRAARSDDEVEDIIGYFVDANGQPLKGTPLVFG
jgi:hypothetical protein